MADKKKYLPPPKRKRQRHIQAYFDPQIEDENFVIEMWDYYHSEGYTQAAFIKEAIRALYLTDSDQPLIPMPSTWQDTMLKKIMKVLQISQMIASGTLVFNGTPSHEQRQHVEDIDAMAQSIAEKMKGVTYDPNQDEGEEW